MPSSRFVIFLAVITLLVSTPVALGQSGEAGFAGGGSLYLDKTARGPSGEAKTGFDSGFAVAAWGGHNMYRHLSGEVRYAYEQNSLKVSSGNTKATFSGRSHAIHYDVLLHTAPAGSAVRPFFVIGGGVKGYQGTGEEQPYQPLQEFVLLSKTTEWKGLVVFGGGVKFAVGRNANLRVEVLDYFTQFPDQVIAAAPGVTVGGWLHNFVPSVGISFGF